MTQLLTVRTFSKVMVALLLFVVLGACQKKSVMAPETTAPEGVAGVVWKAGGFLAYTHSVEFEVDPQVVGQVARVAGYVTYNLTSRRPAVNVSYLLSWRTAEQRHRGVNPLPHENQRLAAIT